MLGFFDLVLLATEALCSALRSRSLLTLSAIRLRRLGASGVFWMGSLVTGPILDGLSTNGAGLTQMGESLEGPGLGIANLSKTAPGGGVVGVAGSVRARNGLAGPAGAGVGTAGTSGTGAAGATGAGTTGATGAGAAGAAAAKAGCGVESHLSSHSIEVVSPSGSPHRMMLSHSATLQ